MDIRKAWSVVAPVIIVCLILYIALGPLRPSRVVKKPLDKRYGDVHDVRAWCTPISLTNLDSNPADILAWMEIGYSYSPDGTVSQVYHAGLYSLQNTGDFYNFPGETLALRLQSGGQTWGADCEDMAFLYWSLCEGKGIAARVVFGSATDPETGMTYGHVVNQVRVGRSWYWVDPIAGSLATLMPLKPEGYTMRWWTDGQNVVETIFGGNQDEPRQMPESVAASWVAHLGH